MHGPREQMYWRAAALVVTGLAALITVQPVLQGSVLRLAAGALFVFFIPGYALQTLIFSSERGHTEQTVPRRTRLALSIGASPAIVGLVGLAINELTGRITFDQVLTVLVVSTGMVLGGSLLLALNTSRESTRLRANNASGSTQRVTARLPRPALSDAVDTDARQQWLLVAIAAVLFIGLITISPPQQSYTELSLLTETERDQLSADSYPEILEPRETTSVVVGIRNEEQTATDYTLVVTREGENSEPVVLNTETVRLLDGESAQLRPTLSAPQAPGEVRFRMRLYRSSTADLPESPASLSEPYREVRLIVTVQPDSDGERQ